MKLRRWVVAALIAVASLIGTAGVASAACSYTHVCRQYPFVQFKVHTSEPGFVASAEFTPPGGLVSLPGVVVPIPPPPGPLPIGDVGLEAQVGQNYPGGDIEVGGVVRTPAGDVSLPGVVVPIPTPPGPLPIGDDPVAGVIARVQDLLAPNPETGGGMVGRALSIDLPVGGIDTRL